MRRASFIIDGKAIDGHFAFEKHEINDRYETRSGKLLIVEYVHNGKFDDGEGDGFFYQTRAATDAEVGEWKKTSVEYEKEAFEKFFRKTEFF